MRVIAFSVLLLSAAAAFAGDLTIKKVFHASIDDDGIQRVEIIGGNYFFDPNHIIVKKDVPVELIVKKKGGIVPHNIVIKESEANIVFKEDIGSDQKIIRFTPNKIGRFFFYCDKNYSFLRVTERKEWKALSRLLTDLYAEDYYLREYLLDF
jgi:hypothetical protein